MPPPTETAPPDEDSAAACAKPWRICPRPFGTVLALRYSQGLSYQEIADLLRWSLPRVKVTLYRAKAAFKDVYLQGERS